MFIRLLVAYGLTFAPISAYHESSSIGGGAECGSSYQDVAASVLRSRNIETEIMFQTHSVFTVGETTYLIRNGQSTISGEATQVFRLTDNIGGSVYVSGKIVVMDGKIIEHIFCSHDYRLAL